MPGHQIRQNEDFQTRFVRAPAGERDHPALILNADFRPLSYYPLSLWSWQDAIKAVFLDRVTVLAEYDAVARSPSRQLTLPSVIALHDYVRPQKHVAFTRFNLFLRDGFQCQYCGTRTELTFDHVVPRSLGGVTSWGNVVAACAPCNLRKANRSLKESGLRLRCKPRRPDPATMLAMGRRFPPRYLHESWLDFLYWDVELEN